MNDLEAWYDWLDALDAHGRNIAQAAVIGALSVSASKKAWDSALTIARGLVGPDAAAEVPAQVKR